MRTKVRFDAEGWIDNCDVLLCPRCGQGYLHQCGVRVYDRNEDAETTVVTEVDGGLVSSHLQPSDKVDNPSSRRDGIAVLFWCETCEEDEGKIELTIAQHKGITQIAWREAVPRLRRWGP